MIGYEMLFCKKCGRRTMHKQMYGEFLTKIFRCEICKTKQKLFK